MSKIENRNKGDKVIVPFSGGKLNKDETNQTGFAIIAGIIGVIISIGIFGTDQRLYSLVMAGIFATFGFIGYRFAKKWHNQSLEKSTRKDRARLR